MKYIEAPNKYEHWDLRNSVFLAGGITDCPDWQADMVGLLTGTDLTLLNPRRQVFPTDDLCAIKKQIVWEHFALLNSDAILFWFPCETLCPIVLYELGAWSKTYKHIFVGLHPEYKRRRDVEIQTNLARPDVKVVFSISDLAAQIKRL